MPSIINIVYASLGTFVIKRTLYLIIPLHSENKKSIIMSSSRHQFTEWPTDLLIDYALKIHHRNIREKGPRLLKLARSIMDENMVMTDIEQLFSVSLNDLENHLSKEENVLFPYLYDLWEAERKNQSIEQMHCGTISNPIRVMVLEHADEVERHQQISALTNDYSAPADAITKAINAMQ